MFTEGQLGVDFLNVDLILPCSTVIFTNTQVLPTDGANCGDTVWSPNPYLVKSWPKKAQHSEFYRVWVKKLGLNKLNRGLHEIKERTDKNKSHCVEISYGLRRLKI